MSPKENAANPVVEIKERTEGVQIKPKPYKFFLGEYQSELKWVNIVILALIHLYGGYAALFGIRWTIPKLLLGSVIHMFAGFGITAGVHRYFSHRSYKANWPLKLLILLSYSFAGQNPVPEWVRDHRVHHKYSETDADPHNSNRGFFFAHVGWLMMKKHPEVIRKGKTIDMSDINDDPLVQWHTKYFGPLKILFCFVMPTLVFHYFVSPSWMEAFNLTMFRYILTLNTTWSVNSAAHMWGYKPFNKDIKPGENLGVSIFSGGEGWHNYHHTFPWDYKASEFGQNFNGTTQVLDILSSIGWAYEMKSASPQLIQKHIDKVNNSSSKHHNDNPVEEVPYEGPN